MILPLKAYTVKLLAYFLVVPESTSCMSDLAQRRADLMQR